MSKLQNLSGLVCVGLFIGFVFYKKRQHGSHIILRRDDPFAQVVVPDHKILDRGTLRAILRQVNLAVDEFNQRLKSL